MKRGTYVDVGFVNSSDAAVLDTTALRSSVGTLSSAFRVFSSVLSVTRNSELTANRENKT